MEDILKKRFWALIHASTKTSLSARFVSLGSNEVRISFDDDRLLVIMLNEAPNEKRALENWVKVLLNEVKSKEIDIVILASTSEADQSLAQGSYEAPWPTRLSITTINENGSAHEITKNQTDDFSKKLIESSLKASLTDESIVTMKDEVKTFIRQEREKMGQLLRFQTQLQATDSIATHILLGVIGFFYLFQIWVGNTDYPPALVRMGANSSILVGEGQYWRLLTSIFLHGSLLHVLVNSYVLFALGTFFNKIVGDTRFVTIFFLSGIAGSMGSAMIGGAVLSVGASGAIWGLFGLGGALTIWPSKFLPDTIRERLKRVMLINLALNFAISFLPMVDIWAHLSGGVAGFALGFFYIYQENHPSRRTFNLLSSIAVILLAILCIGIGLNTQKPWQLNQPLHFTTRFIEKNNLSVDIPSIISSISKDLDSTIFGDGFDPMQIRVTSSTEPALPKTLDAQSEFLAQYLEDSIVHLGNAPIKVKVEDINGFPTASTVFADKNGDTRWIWLQAQNDLLISIIISASSQTPSHLLTNLENIVRSLRMSVSI